MKICIFLIVVAFAAVILAQSDKLDFFMLICYAISSLVAFLFYHIHFVPFHYRCAARIKDCALRMRKAGDRPPPFPNGWYELAASYEIKPGMAKDVNCLGENFVVFRTVETKTVYVLDAYCPHLGANMGVGGLISGECIECPFHRWKFSGVDGSLVDIPYTEDSENLRKVTKARKWTSREVNGLIFVWYHAEKEEPWEIPVQSEIKNGEMWFHGSITFTANAHIQDMPENSADFAHFIAIHGPSILSGTDIRKFRSDTDPSELHVFHTKWTPSEQLKHVSTLDVRHETKVQLYRFMRFDCSRSTHYGPGYTVINNDTVLGRITVLQTTTPVEPLQQRVTFYFYAPRRLGLIIRVLMFSVYNIVMRDSMVWEYKTFVRNPPLPREEQPIKQFRAWFGQFYTENSKSYREVRDDLSW